MFGLSPVYRLSITGIDAGAAIGLMLIGATGLAVRGRRPLDIGGRRHCWRWVALAAVLLVAQSAWAVNTSFDYLPNVGSLLSHGPARRPPHVPGVARVVREQPGLGQQSTGPGRLHP